VRAEIKESAVIKLRRSNPFWTNESGQSVDMSSLLLHLHDHAHVFQ
jgi:hypothetical protein